MNTQEQRKLSESLLAACKAAGIEKPRYITQDKNGDVCHNADHMPEHDNLCKWTYTDTTKYLDHPPYATDWQESLLEFRDYALIRTCDKCQAITAIDMVGNDENEKELQYDGETVFRVSKEEARKQVDNLNKCACKMSGESLSEWSIAEIWYSNRRSRNDYKENKAVCDITEMIRPDHIAATSKMIDPYKVQVGGVTLDPYMIASIYGISDPIIFQMLKKLLRFGRKHKDAAQDVVDTITSAIRWLEINAPESAKTLTIAMTEKGETK